MDLNRIGLAPLPTSDIPDLFQGVIWGLFGVDGYYKVQKAWDETPRFERDFQVQPSVPKKVTSMAYCAANATMIVDWFMRYCGYTLIFSSLRILPLLGNIGYSIFYAARFEEGKLNAQNANQVDVISQKIALSHEKTYGSGALRHYTFKTLDFTFGAFAFLSSAGGMLGSTVLLAASSSAMTLYLAAAVVLLADLVFNSSKLADAGTLQNRVLQLL